MTRITGSTVRHYVTDALGSVVALTDDSGAVKTTYVYDAFGNATVSGESTDNPFQFAGRENDGTGLLYERNRYYSYEMLRYISEDPIRLRGGDVNFFVRVGNNPVNWVDPMGLTRDCSYYTQLCQEYGGIYYCSIAPAICSNTPDIGNWSNCVAECLQNFEEKYGCGDPCNNSSSNGYTGACTKDAHAYCWVSCATGNDTSNPTFPTPPNSGPPR